MESQPEKPRRKRRWILLALPLGLLLLVLAAPTVLSGPAAGIVAGKFSDSRRGSLEVESLKLAWFSEQAVEGAVLRDPEGDVVGRAAVRMPSLFALLKGGMGDLGTIAIDLEADLVMGEEGQSNLQRALEAVEPAPESEEESGGGGSLPRVEVVLRAPRITYSDPRTRAAGTPVEIRDLEATLQVRPDEPLRLVGTGRIQGERAGALNIDLALAGVVGAPEGAKPELKLELAATAVPTGLVDALGATGGLLADVAGPAVDLEVRAAEDRSFRLDLSAERLQLAVQGELQDEQLLLAAERAVEGSVVWSQALADLLAEKTAELPVQVERTGGAERLQLTGAGSPCRGRASSRKRTCSPPWTASGAGSSSARGTGGWPSYPPWIRRLPRTRSPRPPRSSPWTRRG